MFLTMNLAAGQVVEFVEQFDHVRLMEAASGLSMEFYRAGREVDEALAVATGYSESFAQPCDKLRITNGATAQAVTFATRLGSKVSYDKPPTGAVEVVKNTARRGMMYWGVSVVGTASSVIKYDNLARGYLLMANQSDTGTVWVRFNGSMTTTAATVGMGLKLGPGESFEMSSYIHIYTMTAVSESGTVNLLMVEGDI